MNLKIKDIHKNNREIYILIKFINHYFKLEIIKKNI